MRRSTPIAAVLALVLAVVSAQCGGGARTPTAPQPPPNTEPPPGTVPPPPPPPPAAPQTLVGAGDIAMCGSAGVEQTARLLDTIGGTIFTTGDNAYFTGSLRDFQTCYQPTWGRHRDRTRPTPGNHEYETDPTASGYYQYFGPQAGPPGLGYYSYPLGDWHVIALNSAIGIGPSTAQGRWLAADLAANTSKCTVAYFHHPLFTSGPNGRQMFTIEVWRVLYDANVDIIINGHDHTYERFAPQTPDGVRDDTRGIRQFVVGTGGAALYAFTSRSPNSDRQIGGTFGLLKLTLQSDRYQWDFVPVAGGQTDNGTGTCH